MSASLGCDLSEFDLLYLRSVSGQSVSQQETPAQLRSLMRNIEERSPHYLLELVHSAPSHSSRNLLTQFNSTLDEPLSDITSVSEKEQTNSDEFELLFNLAVQPVPQSLPLPNFDFELSLNERQTGKKRRTRVSESHVKQTNNQKQSNNNKRRKSTSSDWWRID